MTIPDAAIEAAAAALRADAWANKWFPGDHTGIARAAVEAAMPAIRESIAQEIEAMPVRSFISFGEVRSAAARIVRGGTP